MPVAEERPGEVLDPPMSRKGAEKFDRRIRCAARATGDQLGEPAALVNEAKAGWIHVALGYRSWTAYLSAAVGGIVCGQYADVRREEYPAYPRTPTPKWQNVHDP